MLRTSVRRRLLPWLLAGLAACAALDDAATSRSADAPTSRATGRDATARDRLERAHRRLADIVSADACAKTAATLVARPHHAGSIANYRTAKWIEGEFLRAGLETRIEEFEVPLPYPDETTVEMLRPVAYRAPLSEERLKMDFDTHAGDILSPYLAYAADGDVTGPVVYVNYGTAADWDRLAAIGLDARDCIAVARHGRVFRGAKVLEAKRRGAAALLLYSDPADDGFVKGPVYPDGPWRPKTAVQRGSVLDIAQRPGDPLTPGVPATADAKRLALSEAPTLPGLPAATLSWGDAEPILKALEGAAVPEGWQGGLPFPYRLGGTEEVVVRVKTASDWRLRKIHNVIGTLRGSRSPEEWVIMGNHRDAWVHGAADPGSGTVAMVEAARALGDLAREGLRPARSIVFCSFDAEEFGIIGSTEHVEGARERLAAKAVLYVNCDTAVTGGNFSAWASPPIAALLAEALASQPDDRTPGRSLLDALPSGPAIQWPGGGSDHAPFVHMLGIPAAEAGSGGPYGVYHSLYDTFGWMKKFGDPGFVHHARMTRALAAMLLEAAEQPLIPYDALAQVAWIEKELDAVLAGTPEATSEPLGAARAEARAAAIEFEAAYAAALRNPELRADPTTADALLLRLKDVWVAGSPADAFYRNVLVATNPADGYSAVTLPALRKASASGPTERAAAVAIFAERLTMYAGRLRAVAAALGR